MWYVFTKSSKQFLSCHLQASTRCIRVRPWRCRRGRRGGRGQCKVCLNILFCPGDTSVDKILLELDLDLSVVFVVVLALMESSCRRWLGDRIPQWSWPPTAKARSKFWSWSEVAAAGKFQPRLKSSGTFFSTDNENVNKKSSVGNITPEQQFLHEMSQPKTSRYLKQHGL